MENNTLNNQDNIKNKRNNKRFAITVACVCGSLIVSCWVTCVFVTLNNIINTISIETVHSIDTIDSVINKDNTEKVERDYDIKKTEIIDNYTESDVADMVSEVMPAMVSVTARYNQQILGYWGEPYYHEASSCGSGIIIGESNNELLIATNCHVIADSDNIEITLKDGTITKAYLKGTNPQMDLAVVSVILDDLSDETIESIAIAKLGNSESLRLGEQVIAIGNSLGYGQSVTTGVVSALNREVISEDGTVGCFIQTDAAINPGNSGGALLNTRGEVIGINSSKIGGEAIEGVGFAIPISEAEPIISSLSEQSTKIKVEEANRGYLGIIVDERTSEYTQMYGMPQGVFVSDLSKGGGAELAGIQKHDIITRVDTFDIDNFADLTNALQYYNAGETVSVELMRVVDGLYTSITLEVTLGTIPEA